MRGYERVCALPVPPLDEAPPLLPVNNLLHLSAGSEDAAGWSADEEDSLEFSRETFSC